jgi:hypothetical protein
VRRGEPAEIFETPACEAFVTLSSRPSGTSPCAPSTPWLAWDRMGQFLPGAIPTHGVVLARRPAVLLPERHPP